MSTPERTLHLNAFLMSTGHHEASWRLPESDPLAGTDVRHFQNLATIAERGKFDSVFFADSPVIFGDVGRRPAGRLEPTVLLTALAAVTEKIGLIATASTTYNDPYNLARRFASVDVVSGGRAGWNVVTTAGPDAARNFGIEDQPSHAARYERAAEFLDVAGKLWDSWDDDAVIADKESGVWADANRVRAINHAGKHFSVQGPLNVPRSPQGYPLLVQAGSSDDGKDLAARYAEAVFTAQQTLADAQAFYSDLKGRAAAAGRDPEGIKILPGIVPVIGSTESEARKLDQQLEDLHQPGVCKGPAGEDAAGGSRRSCPGPPAPGGSPQRGRDRGLEEPVHADCPAGAPGEPDRQAAHRPAWRRTGAPDLHRDAGTGGRCH
jgi:FMN-dependent oxidoreductase (nitrilotriacetate monooxygenase family)